VHHLVLELWESLIHLLGSFDGTKEDPQTSPRDHGGRTHPRPRCSTQNHKGGRTKDSEDEGDYDNLDDHESEEEQSNVVLFTP